MENKIMLGIFSVSSITEKLSLLLKRFPVSVLFVIGFAVLWFVSLSSKFEDMSYRLWIFFPVGAFISVAATLFAENFFNSLKTCGITLVAVLLWGIYCIFLPEKGSDIWMGKWIEICVISGAAFFAMFFISFLEKNRDRAFWNFTTQTLSQMALACCFGAILFGGLSLALLAIDSLFNVSIDGEVYAYLAVICFALFAPVYFLANIPGKTDKHIDKMFYAKGQKILALYILSPILALYAVILYVYLFKIIIAWELPNGWVSWLVSVFALGGLLVIMFLFPVREQENNKVVNFISRWFGLIILPLLLLMSIGIFRRMDDYGITINRIYILLLNLWFYGIYIYLFFSRSRHIKWILISPVVVALMTSISAWSVANVTKNLLTKEVSTILNKQVSFEGARAIFAEMTQEDKDRMKSTLEYLYNNFGKESIQTFFTDTVSDSYWSFLSELDLRDALDEESESISYYADRTKTWKIEGYNTFTRIEDYSGYVVRDDAKKDTIEIFAGNRTLFIPIREIALENLVINKKLQDERDVIVKGNDYTLLISSFYGDYYPEKDSIFISSLDGYLFFK